MHRVKFSVKNVEVNDPEYKLLSDRVAYFQSLPSAVDFIRSLRSKLQGKEVLIGKPELDVA